MSSCDINFEEFWEERKKSQKASFTESAEKEFCEIISKFPINSPEYQRLLLVKQEFIKKSVEHSLKEIELLEELAFESFLEFFEGIPE